MSKVVRFVTLGCKVNQYETNAMAQKFLEKGYQIIEEITPENEDIKPDICIINTCTVTNMSDRKSRQMLRRMKEKNPSTIVVAVGCYAQVAKKELSKIPEIDLVLGNNEKVEIVKYVEEYINNHINNVELDDVMYSKEFSDFGNVTYTEKNRAVVKVQDGCNQFCSYCCSIQTHINTSKDSIVNLINMLSKVENNKMEIFSNSYMKETNLKNSRKYLWENSNFGPLNIGTNPNYNNLEDLLNDYSKRNLFFVERNNKYLLLNAKQPLNKYLDKKRVKATDEYGKTCYVVPSYSDLDNFRSYRSVELTKYGTLEIRSDCTQSKENIFKLIAFNVGVCKNHLEILKYLDMNKKITNERLVEFCIKGLKMRNFGEEKYMEVSND